MKTLKIILLVVFILGVNIFSINAIVKNPNKYLGSEEIKELSKKDLLIQECVGLNIDYANFCMDLGESESYNKTMSCFYNCVEKFERRLEN